MRIPPVIAALMLIPFAPKLPSAERSKGFCSCLPILDAASKLVAASRVRHEATQSFEVCVCGGSCLMTAIVGRIGCIDWAPHTNDNAQKQTIRRRDNFSSIPGALCLEKCAADSVSSVERFDTFTWAPGLVTFAFQ